MGDTGIDVDSLSLDSEDEGTVSDWVVRSDERCYLVS